MSQLLGEDAAQDEEFLDVHGEEVCQEQELLHPRRQFFRDAGLQSVTAKDMELRNPSSQLVPVAINRYILRTTYRDIFKLSIQHCPDFVTPLHSSAVAGFLAEDILCDNLSLFMSVESHMLLQESLENCHT